MRCACTAICTHKVVFCGNFCHLYRERLHGYTRNARRGGIRTVKSRINLLVEKTVEDNIDSWFGVTPASKSLRRVTLLRALNDVKPGHCSEIAMLTFLIK